MKNVVITGPTGAIGIALINELIKNNIRVTAICHKRSKRIANIPVSELVTIVECDIEDIKDCIESLPHDYDVFFSFCMGMYFWRF